MIWLSLGLGGVLAIGFLAHQSRTRHISWCITTFFKAILTMVQPSTYGDEYEALYNANACAKVVTSSHSKPVLVLRDPHLIKNVLAKDFEYFTDRARKGNSGELYDLDGEIWSMARKKLLPAFSPESLKEIFKYFTSDLGTLITRLSPRVGRNADITLPLKLCVSDIISSAIFGLQITIGHKKEEFTQHALSIIERGLFRSVKASLKGETRLPSKAERYFKGFLSKKLQSSVESYQRDDYVKLILQIKKREALEKGNEEFFMNQPGKNVESPSKIEVGLTDDILQDQILQFLTSGFEPIVSAVIFVLYDLSKDTKNVQATLRKEIASCIASNSGLNYAAIQEMKFLDSCVQESLRLHPPVHTLTRRCTKDYLDDSFEVKCGSATAVPILGVHMDSRFFANPETYSHSRFDSSKAEDNFFYMPFGQGPRKCIGSHFALLVIKTIIAKLVQQFTFELSDKSTKVPPHKYQGPYIVPNDITFNLTLAKTTSLLSQT